MGLSRRSILKGGLFASAALPLMGVSKVVGQWRENELQQELAVVGNPDNPLVKLNSNENPYGPSDKARQAIIEAIDSGNRYPRPAITKLTKQIAEYEGLSPDQIIITAGSTELLGVFGLMAGMQKGKVIGCDPTFDFMLYFAEKYSSHWVKVPLTEDHQYNLEGIRSEMDDDTKLVFICNPNNPTGGELSKDDLALFCAEASKSCMVYVDEAYIEFSKDGLKSSLANMTRNNRNLVVGRTFSKIYGLAGLRVGYAIGHPDTIKEVRRHLQGRSVTASATSIAAASASLGDEEFLGHCRKMNDQAKDIVYTSFDELEIDYIPSSTNFILFRTEKFGATDIRKELQRQNILIRDYQHVPGWARVSMGTSDEMKAFLKATKKMT